MPVSLAEWLAYVERIHARPIDLGLDRVRRVLDVLGGSVAAPIVVVGGTNGKGSTCAMLERVLTAAGYRVGLYTSPHLLRYNERVRIDGRPASDEALADAFARVEAARAATPLTYFEFGTLAAWQVFSASPLDALILEVGMGGRLDAVNVFDPDCAVVTNVDLDHMEFLGATREAIGFEKAGIFRTGRPALVGDAQPPASLLAHAQAIGAELRLIGRDFGYLAEPGQWQYWRRGEGGVVRRAGLAWPALRGANQLVNASLALAALDALAGRLPVAMQDVRRGLAEVTLPGRFQVLPGQPRVVLDVAHNPHAVGVLADNLGALGYAPRTAAVFGMLADKDIGAVVERMRARIDRWFLAGLPGPRGSRAGALAAQLRQAGVADDAFELHAQPADAYRAARRWCAPDDRIAVFGSFLTVADVMLALEASPPD